MINSPKVTFLIHTDCSVLRTSTILSALGLSWGISPTSPFLVAANVEIKTPVGLLPVVMTHIGRDVEGGCELRSRFWMGYNIIDGKAEYLMPGGAPFPKTPAEQLLGHNFQEFTNLAKILPAIYAEEKDNWN